jgi:hypothetical protein
MPEGELVGEDVIWDGWTPEEVARRLNSVDARWYVVAGWAIDLFRGAQTRDHDDIEIGVPRADFAKVRAELADYEFDVVGSGRRWPLESSAFDNHFQTWVRQPKTDIYRLDVFRDPHDGDDWLCRRDERIRMPYVDLIRYSAEGIPYMSPEVALLFKAKGLREKDQIDFDGTLPLLDAQQRSWLKGNLEILHPSHDWIEQLSVV